MSRIVSATVRVSDDEYLHIECRFSDGQKYAAVMVDADHPELAHDICEYLNMRERMHARIQSNISCDALGIPREPTP